jgi:hypothetical protein
VYNPTRNFFEPAQIINGKPYKVWKYEEVLKEQLLIGVLSKGAVSLEDTNNLPINDRRILLNTLQKAENDKIRRLEDMQSTRNMQRNKRF